MFSVTYSKFTNISQTEKYHMIKCHGSVHYLPTTENKYATGSSCVIIGMLSYIYVTRRRGRHSGVVFQQEHATLGYAS